MRVLRTPDGNVMIEQKPVYMGLKAEGLMRMARAMYASVGKVLLESMLGSLRTVKRTPPSQGIREASHRRDELCGTYRPEALLNTERSSPV